MFDKLRSAVSKHGLLRTPPAACRALAARIAGHFGGQGRPANGNEGWDERTVPADFYRGPDYDSLSRFVSYWYQIDEVRRAEPANLLEIGVGNGFLSRYLRHHGYDVVTLDINAQVRPDISASVSQLPVGEGAVDVTCAFEVLEHVELGDVIGALAEIRRVTRRRALLSVPNRTPAHTFQYSLAGSRRRWLMQRGRSRAQLPHYHRWEIGCEGISLGDLERWIRAAGFRVDRDYRLFEHPYHHFFALETAQTAI